MHPKHHGYVEDVLKRDIEELEELEAEVEQAHHHHHHHHQDLLHPPLPPPPPPPPPPPFLPPPPPFPIQELPYPPPLAYPPLPIPPYLPFPPPHPHDKLVQIFSKAHKDFALAIHHDKLVVMRADSDRESQQWIKDEKFASRVQDVYGHPAFMLINKAFKKVLKHTKGKHHQVHLMDYDAFMDIENEELLWTESQDFGEGFKTIRKANDTLLNLSVLHAHELENGSSLILDTWHKKDNQLWKMLPL